jgi:voltage-gated potassium channel
MSAFPSRQQRLLGGDPFAGTMSSDDDIDVAYHGKADPDAIEPTLSHVHRTAFRSRSKGIRDEFLASRLSAEDEYNETLYELCREYQSHYVGDYREYKRMLAEEEFLAEEWEALTAKQRAGVIFHRPMLTPIGRAIAVFSTLVALGSTVALMLETMPEYNPAINSENVVLFNLIEGLTTLYFTAETVSAFITHPRPLQYVITAPFVIDVISCLPLYLTLVFGTFIPRVSAIVDTLRVTRLFRINKYVGSLRPVATLTAALTKTLSVLTGPLFSLIACCVVAAAGLYYAQRGTWDPARGAFVITDCDCEASAKGVNATEGLCPQITTRISDGIPTTTWWGFVTIITVGYGDIVPRCALGRVIAGLCMVISSVVMAMPIAILGESFTDEASRVDDDVARAKASLATITSKQHERVLQMAAAYRLHDIRPQRLTILLRRAGLPVRGQPADMVRSLYRLLGLPPTPPQDDESALLGGNPSLIAARHELPAVLTLAESFIEYIRLRIPYEIVDLRSPPKEVLAVMDAFFERVFAWWTKRDATNLAHRLECSSKTAAQRIVPLVEPADYTIGIAADPTVPPPDIVLPLPMQTSSSSRIAFGPRMASLRVLQRFGVMVYVLAPIDTFRPLVNGHAIDAEVELRDRDVINFGNDDTPLLYTFARADEFARGHTATKHIDLDLPTKVWTQRHPIDEVLGPVAPIPRPTVGAQRPAPREERSPAFPAVAGAVSPPRRHDWHVDGDVPSTLSREDMQPHFFL